MSYTYFICACLYVYHIEMIDASRICEHWRWSTIDASWLVIIASILVVIAASLKDNHRRHSMSRRQSPRVGHMRRLIGHHWGYVHGVHASSSNHVGSSWVNIMGSKKVSCVARRWCRHTSLIGKLVVLTIVEMSTFACLLWGWVHAGIVSNWRLLFGTWTPFSCDNMAVCKRICKDISLNPVISCRVASTI